MRQYRWLDFLFPSRQRQLRFARERVTCQDAIASAVLCTRTERAASSPDLPEPEGDRVVGATVER